MDTIVAVLSKTGEDAAPTAIKALDKIYGLNEACFGLATYTKIFNGKSVQALSAKTVSPITMAYGSTRLSGERETILKLENATLLFSGIVYPVSCQGSFANFISKQFEELDKAKSVSSFVDGIEGDFSLVINEQDRILLARDPVGVQPLYFGENEAFAAVASNRKAMWTMGIEEPKSFPPGNLAVVSQTGFVFEPLKTLDFKDPKVTTLDEASVKLQALLECSTRLRVSGEKKVAVAFSGGLDSCVVAFLASKCGVEVELIHVSLENRHETEEAWEAAEELRLPIQVHLYKESDVEKTIREVVNLIEEPNPVKASIGVPFYWNAQKAAAAGHRVLLAGQGADELFGGYQRYVTEYIQHGDASVRKTMFHDVTGIHESNLERDEKICDFHGVELRLPFASFDLAEFAVGLPVQLKFEKKADSLRKLTLRKVAENLGIPRSLAERPKKAVQYSTGINNALKRIAKKRDLTVSEYIESLFEDVKRRY